MTVSVLIPCNNPFFLKEAVVSILEQGLLGYEILVVLNGEGILDSKAIMNFKGEFPKNVRWLYSNERGIVPSLNLGLNEARFELIARLDADDVMLPGRLQHQIAHFEKDRHLVLLGSQIKIMKASKTEVRMKSTHYYPDGEQLVRAFLRRDASFAHPSVMYRKSVLQRIGGYSDKYPGIEDWELWTRLSEQGRVYNCRVPMTAYRVHGEQYSQRENSQVIESAEKMILERTLFEVSSIREKNSVAQIENTINIDFGNINSIISYKTMRMIFATNKRAIRLQLNLLGVVLESKWTIMRLYKSKKIISRVRYFLLFLLCTFFRPSILITSLSIRSRAILRRFLRGEILGECLRDDHR